MAESDDRPVQKIIIIGESAVGKTSIRRKYMGESFNNTYIATIGADFSYFHQGNTKFSIWDIAGEPNYKSVRKHFYLGASAAIFVFDITRPDTLDKFTNWVTEISSEYEKEIPYMIVGNKEDLRDDNDEVISKDYVEDQVKNWRQEFGKNLPLFYSSAKTGLNVQTLFDEIIQIIDTKSTNKIKNSEV